MDSISQYFKDTAAELKQVTWPTQTQAMRYTALVIGISVIVSLFVGAFDYAFSQGVNALVTSF